MVNKEEKAIIKYKGVPITITFSDVQNFICPLATEQEIVIFLKTCQSLSLNPWANECYLIKYKEGEKAATVIAIDSYLKAAETNKDYNGHEAGIVLRDSGGKLEFREGALILPDETEKLVGGWARVYRKDRDKSFYVAVNKAECVRYTRDGKLTKFWTTAKQPSMLRKTALKRSLVEAFPSLFAGTMSTAEVAEVEAEYEEVPEDEMPPAYERKGEAYWAKWWARQKEKGLSEADVHRILGIDSIKENWITQGRTLEEAEGIINDALQQSAQEPWHNFWTQANALGLSTNQVLEMLGVGSLKDWTDSGKTLDDAIKLLSEKLSQPEATQTNEAEESLKIDLDWLKESQKTLKWTDETAKTFLVSHYKVSPTGTLTEVLQRLTREQAEDFVKEINSRLEKQQSKLI